MNGNLCPICGFPLDNHDDGFCATVARLIEANPDFNETDGDAAREEAECEFFLRLVDRVGLTDDAAREFTRRHFGGRR